jgi:hypothetical protein
MEISIPFCFCTPARPAMDARMIIKSDTKSRKRNFYLLKIIYDLVNAHIVIPNIMNPIIRVRMAPHFIHPILPFIVFNYKYYIS